MKETSEAPMDVSAEEPTDGADGTRDTRAEEEKEEDEAPSRPDAVSKTDRRPSHGAGACGACGACGAEVVPVAAPRMDVDVDAGESHAGHAGVSVAGESRPHRGPACA